MDTLRVCTFKGIQNLALYVAQREGFFAARDLHVEESYTTGSAPQLAGLVRGDHDLVQTAPDNVVNANSDPAAFGLDPANAPRVVMLMGGSTGPLGLYARPDVATLDALHGHTLGVDNPSSGFALVMRDMLRRAGLEQGRDYSIAVAGGTSARLGALQSRAVAATILYAPYDALAAEEGFQRLVVSTDCYAAYASLCTAALMSWVESHSGAVTRYSAAVLAALRWIHDPAHADATREVLRTEPALGLDAATAARALAAFVAPSTGFGVDARLSDAGLRQVIALRTAYGNASRLGAPDDYLDLRWYRQALAEI